MEHFEYEIEALEVTGKEPGFTPHNPLCRPQLNYGKGIFAAIVFVLLLVGGSLGFRALLIACKVSRATAGLWGGTLGSGVAIFYLLLIAKKAVIWLVKLYQRLAPDHVRLRCAFEPSCSEYMILAITKYGLVKGLTKGIGRLFRCHAPGGVDYP